jgi:flagellar motility protein MotE (MotC chaperone)
MSRMPRIIPLTAVAIAGVLAINAITRGPDLLSAAKAFAEDAGAPKAGAKPAVSPNATIAANTPAAKPVAPVCAPTAAELAKEAGLSPAELQVLQSLGSRRGQLDQRESDLDTQVQLIAAAEAKLDSRIKEMTGLKSDIQGLLTQADQQQAAETGRLIRVYEAMNPKDAAGRMATMEDGVRLPIAAKMKERSLAAILGKMDTDAARILTEKLAHRIDASQSVANARSALNPPATPAPAPAKTAPTKTAQAAPADASAAAAPDATDTTTPKPKPAVKPHRLAKARPKPAGTQVADAKPLTTTAPPLSAPPAAVKPASPAISKPAVSAVAKPSPAAPPAVSPAASPAAPPPAKTG